MKALRKIIQRVEWKLRKSVGTGPQLHHRHGTKRAKTDKVVRVRAEPHSNGGSGLLEPWHLKTISPQSNLPLNFIDVK